MNIRRRNRTQPPRLILASSNRGNSELFVVPGEAAQDSENTARAMVVDLQGTSLELLVQECKAGSREAFSALVEHYQKRLFNFLCHLTGNAHDAEDLTQETFLKVYHNIHRFNSTHAFGTWLFTIAKRTAYNHFRKNKRSQPAPAEEQEQVDPEDPSSLLEQKDEKVSFWKVAQALKSDQYQILWLRYAEGFSIAEIARILNTNQIRVRVLLHRARKNLAKHLSAKRMYLRPQ